jgi:hypothetical protein
MFIISASGTDSAISYFNINYDSAAYAIRYTDMYDTTALRAGGTTPQFYTINQIVNTFAAGTINVPNYSDTGKYKTTIGVTAAPNPTTSTSGLAMQWSGGTINSNSAVTSVLFQSALGGALRIGTRISLYGIKRA